MSLTIQYYFSLDTAIPVLCEIDPHGSTLNELDERSPVSRSAISERIEQGRSLGLIEVFAVNEPDVRIRHRLTPKGATIRLVLDDMGTTAAYEQYRDAKQRFENHAEESKERILNHVDALDDAHSEAHDDALDRLLDRPDYSTEVEDKEE